MSKYLVFLTVCFTACFSTVQAQKEGNVWMFGFHAGLDFSSGNPVSIRSAFGTDYDSDEGGASVCDRNGQLLFYTNGSYVWDRNNNLMPNAGPLTDQPNSGNTTPTTSTSQGALIVPMIDSPGKYIIFSLSSFEFDLGKLYYSVVDMSLNGGLGDVVSNRMAIMLNSDGTEKLTAVKGDKCNTWVMTRSIVANEYKAYEITSAGLNTTPVISTCGTLPLMSYLGGLIKFSEDRKKMVATCMVAYDIGGIELYDFNSATGIVSNPDLIESGFTSDYYGTSFSPNGSRLYTNIISDSVYQFDLTAPPGTIGATKKGVGFMTDIGDLKLGPDGKIYGANASNSPVLSVINKPDLLGAACQFVLNGVSLIAGTSSTAGLPNVIVAGDYVQDTVKTRSDKNLCLHETETELKAPGGYREYLWSDNSTGDSYIADTAGICWVMSTKLCGAAVDTFVVQQVDPSFSLGNDTATCDGSAILLSASVLGANYLWQDGHTDSFYNVVASGVYTLEVDLKGCKEKHTVSALIQDVRQNLDEDVMLCDDEVVYITLKANAVSGGSILWSNGSTAPNVLVTDTGTYWVTVSAPFCIGSDTMTVAGKVCECKFGMPSAFSPNGDGHNDVLRPWIQPECQVKTFEIAIYNRWGQLVYSGVDPLGGWNGQQDGAPCEVGTYMYKMGFAGGTKSEQQRFLNGDITLIR